MAQANKAINYHSIKQKEEECSPDRQDSHPAIGKHQIAQVQIIITSPLNSENHRLDKESIKLSNIDHYSFYQLSNFKISISVEISISNRPPNSLKISIGQKLLPLKRCFYSKHQLIKQGIELQQSLCITSLRLQP